MEFPCKLAVVATMVEPDTSLSDTVDVCGGLLETTVVKSVVDGVPALVAVVTTLSDDMKRSGIAVATMGVELGALKRGSTEKKVHEWHSPVWIVEGSVNKRSSPALVTILTLEVIAFREEVIEEELNTVPSVREDVVGGLVVIDVASWKQTADRMKVEFN